VVFSSCSERVIHASECPLGPVVSILLTDRIVFFFWPKLWNFNYLSSVLGSVRAKGYVMFSVMALSG
jgi:hypothetical protein